ncbi:MAG: TlyA family RNA methyltransferase [Hyphomonadaceae bacterium]|nr:TlyA family RNA methyltransferase [Hyphomonadaceae bacterium]
MAFSRADKVLVELGHFESRAAARAAIEAGRVMANGTLVTRPAQPLDPAAEIKAEPAHPYVSRAGLKLAHGLALWPDIRVEGTHCLDIGASTGGFSQVLLEQGARHVVAVDVGTGQLHPRIAGDVRVTNLEQTDARDLTEDQIGAPDLIVCDASFIALEKLLGPVLANIGTKARCDGILLFKPQFQVGRKNVGRGGIVRDVDTIRAAEAAFAEWLAATGWKIADWADSPIRGGDGNAERLVWIQNC